MLVPLGPRASAVVCLAVGASLLSSVAAGQAADEHPTARLLYVRGPGAEGCPDETVVRDAVASRLGYVPFVEVATRVIEVELRRGDDGLTGRVALIDAGEPAGERSIEGAGSDCGELAAALELAVAIAIDPLALSRPAPPPEPAPPPPAVIATPDPERPPALAPAPVIEPGPDVHARVLLTGHAAFLVAPTVTGGVTVGGGVRVESFSIGLEGRADFPASGDALGGQVEVSTLLLTLVPCVHIEWFVGCVVGGGGALRGAGSGFADPAEVTTGLGVLGGRIGVEIPIVGLLRAHISGDVLAHLTRTTLRVGTEPAWRSEPVSVRLGAGILLEP